MLLRRIIGHLKDQNWFAVVLDLVVVVVGIFLAFQVDRWYAAKSQEANAGQRIAALVEDFAYNRDELSYIMRRQESVVDGAENLLKLDKRHISVDDHEQFYEWLAAASWTAAPRLRRGGYDVLISTGTIDLIRDQSLHQDLAEFYAVSDELLKFHEGTVAIDTMLFVPYVTENLDHVKMIEYVHPPNRPRGIRQDSLLQDKSHFLSVVGTQEFEGVVSAKWHRARDELARMEDMQASLRSIELRLQRLSGTANPKGE